MSESTPPKDYESDARSNTSIEASLRSIESELKVLSQHKAVSLYNSVFKQLLLQFLRGIFLGLGTAMGATIVLSGLLFLLSQIEFVPIIGEWVQLVILEIKGEEGT